MRGNFRARLPLLAHDPHAGQRPCPRHSHAPDGIGALTFNYLPGRIGVPSLAPPGTTPGHNKAPWTIRQDHPGARTLRQDPYAT